MKEFIAREIIYFFVALIIAVPTAIFFMQLMDLETANGALSDDEKVLEMEFILLGAFLGFIGTYITRGTIWAIKTYILP